MTGAEADGEADAQLALGIRGSRGPGDGKMESCQTGTSHRAARSPNLRPLLHSTLQGRWRPEEPAAVVNRGGDLVKGVSV